MDSQKIGNYVREKLKSKGITQEAFAEKLNKSASAISQKLNGEISFVIEELVIISEIIGESVDTILHAGSSNNAELYAAIKKNLEQVKILEKRGVQLDSLGAIEIAVDVDKEEIVVYLVLNNWYKDGLHKNLKYLSYIFRKKNQLLVGFLYYDTSRSNKWILPPSRIELPSLSYANLGIALFKKVKVSDLLKKEHLEIVKSTVDSGVDFGQKLPYFEKTSSNQIEENIVDIFMLIAVESDNLEMFNYFHNIEKPSQSDKRNRIRYNQSINNEASPEIIRYAIYCKSFEITNYLLKDKLPYDRAMMIIESKNLEFFLKFDNSKINQPFHKKMLLSRAVELGSLEMVGFLIESSDQQDKYEAMEHVQEGDIEMVKFLLSKGAAFSTKDSEGGNRTPLVAVTNVIKNLLNTKLK